MCSSRHSGSPCPAAGLPLHSLSLWASWCATTIPFPAQPGGRSPDPLSIGDILPGACGGNGFGTQAVTRTTDGCITTTLPPTATTTAHLPPLHHCHACPSPCLLAASVDGRCLDECGAPLPRTLRTSGGGLGWDHQLIFSLRTPVTQTATPRTPSLPCTACTHTHTHTLR